MNNIIQIVQSEGNLIEVQSNFSPVLADLTIPISYAPIPGFFRIEPILSNVKLQSLIKQIK